MKSYDFNELRKREQCIRKGHDLRRCHDGSAHFKCKCGALAWVTEEKITVKLPPLQSTQEKTAEREARKNAHLGLRQ